MQVLSGIRDYVKEGGYIPDLVQSDVFHFEATVPAAGTPVVQPNTIRVPAGYRFVMRRLTGFWQRFPGIANDIQGIPYVQFQIRESGGKRNVFDQAVPLAYVVGSDASRQALELPVYYAFHAGADLTVTFTITNAAAWNAIGMGAAKQIAVGCVGDLVAEGAAPTGKE